MPIARALTPCTLHRDVRCSINNGTSSEHGCIAGNHAPFGTCTIWWQSSGLRLGMPPPTSLPRPSRRSRSKSGRPACHAKKPFSMQQRSCLRSLVPLLPLRLLSGGRPLRKPPQTRRHLHASRGAGQRGAVRPVHQDRPAGKKRVRRTSHQMNEALEQEARHAQEFKAAHKKATPEQKALLLAELQK